MSWHSCYLIGLVGHFPAFLIVQHRDDREEFGAISFVSSALLAAAWPAYAAWLLLSGYWDEFCVRRSGPLP